MNDTESRKAFEAWCNETGRYFTTQNTEAWSAWKHLYAEVKGLELKYNELLMAVARRFEGETRHETALRYINQSELPSCGVAAELRDENE